MVDITDKATERGPSETRLKDAEGKPMRRSKTAGEIAFDRVVYTGIGFGVNEASSLWITDQFKHGNNLLERAPGFLKTMGSWFSRTGFDRISDRIAEIFKLEAKIVDGKTFTPRMRGNNTLLMATLLSGGTLLVWPMKKIEDHKNYWVKKANHFIDWFRGQKLSPEEVAARDAEVEQAIACSPRQSWPSLLAGRVIAMFSSWATGTFIVKEKGNERVGQFSENVITHTMQETNTLVGASNSSWLAKLASNDKFKRYANLTGIETYSCAISSIVLEIASKFLAKFKPRVHDPEVCKETSVQPPAVPVPAPDSDSSEQKVIPALGKAMKQKLSCSHCHRIDKEKQADAQPSIAI